MCGQSEEFTQLSCVISGQQNEPNGAHYYNGNDLSLVYLSKEEKHCEIFVARVKSSPNIGVHKLTFKILA